MKTELKAKKPRYIFEIPEQLRNDFEAACAIRGMKRVDVMLKFIRAYVDADKVILDRLKEKYAIAQEGE